ncbi:MAG: ferritin family protein [Dehalococcoidales bacterium]
MANELTLKEILQMAIEKEVIAQQLYTDLSQRITDEAAKDVFQELIRQEHGHQQLLESYLRGELKNGALSTEQVIGYQIAEQSEQMKIYPGMPLKDICLAAINREMIAHQAYLSLSQAHPEGEVRKLLEEMASQELGHQHKLEFLYSEVAFPQDA